MCEYKYKSGLGCQMLLLGQGFCIPIKSSTKLPHNFEIIK